MAAAAALGAGVTVALVAGDPEAPALPAPVAVTVTVATTAPAPDPRVAVPALVGVRLDEATALLEASALERRIDGGGLLGVLDDSGWVVCATTPATGARVPVGTTVVVRVERSCA